MPWLEDFANTPKGRGTLIGVMVLAGLIVMYNVISFFSPSQVSKLSRQGTFMDAKTGKAFEYEIQIGSTIPVPAPSGGNTGYPAELCYWTRDGKITDDPVPVLLNRYIGKSEPTFCPDCGRLVTVQNAPPMPGDKPPPLEAEYTASRANADERGSK